MEIVLDKKGKSVIHQNAMSMYKHGLHFAGLKKNTNCWAFILTTYLFTAFLISIIIQPAGVGEYRANHASAGNFVSFQASGDDFNQIHNFSVVDVRSMNLNIQEQYLLSSIDGIVNRDEPTVYIIQGDNDLSWLEYINSSENYRGHVIEFSSIYEIIAFYKDYFNGTVTYDSDDPDSANIATPLCGITNSLLVDDDIHTAVDAVLGKPLKYNITAILHDNGLVTRAKKYEYAFHHFYSSCNSSALAYYLPSATMSLRSFLICEKIFTLWNVLYIKSSEDTGSVPPDDADELAVVEMVLSNTPTNIPIFGYPFPDGGNEGVAVSALSRHGKYLIPSDWIHNLPFLSRMKLPSGYRFHQNRAPESDCSLENKIYITAIYSDGDNIQYVQNFMHDNLWMAPGRGLFPLSWTLSPSLSKLMPYVLKFYYENGTSNDYFVSGLCGKGYMYPRDMDQDVLRAYLDDSKILWSIADMRETTTMNLDNARNVYTENIDLDVIYDGYGGNSYVEPDLVNGIPIISNIGVSGDANDTFDLITKIRSFNPIRPLFISLHLHCWSITIDEWNQLATRLSEFDDVKIVRTDEFSWLLNRSCGSVSGPKFEWMIMSNIMVIAFISVYALSNYILLHARYQDNSRRSTSKDECEK
ncbi:MAG: GxGYxYP domain-containing protein [Promethearchaeota archaeon]